MAKILIIDDDKNMCRMLCETGRRLGHQTISTLSLAEGLQKALSEDFDLVFLDVWLPDGNGTDRLHEIREASSSPEVIIITGAGDPEGAELAIMSGAWDYIEKPFSVDAVALRLMRAIQFREQKRARISLSTRKENRFDLKRDTIVGNSPTMALCLDLLAQAAQSDASVLITGETGTGKEQFAWAIHENSRRADKAFVTIDCAALPETLVESMLFGHEKGVFTGANRSRAGMIRQADGGTLVLDEIGELPLSIQKSFLRVLQEHRFRPLGGAREIQSDFRLVAVTNRNLDQMVNDGLFRDDLLFRIRSFAIHLPPLRERHEDIHELATYYTRKLCDRYDLAMKDFSPEFLNGLMSYHWPGNVRELFQALERVVMAARHESVLFPDHLPIRVRARAARASVAKNLSAGGASLPPNLDPFKDIPTLCDYRQGAIAEAEKSYIQNLMSLKNVSFNEICKIAGLSRPRLYTLMRKYGITRRFCPEEADK